MRLSVILAVSAGVCLPGLFTRAIWHDEAVTLLETAGSTPPLWPLQPAPARIAQKQFAGTPTFRTVIEALRLNNHPPVYSCLLSVWRRGFGFSLETARAFSLLCSVGTLLVLYLLLRTARIQYPLVPLIVYATSTGAVYLGHEARSYALASLLVTTAALFAFLASQAALRNRRAAIAPAIAMAVCCGVALQTHYLTFFPVCVILFWSLVCLWPVTRSLAIVCVLIAVSIGSVGFATLLGQIRTRPHQFEGFVGAAAEAREILRLQLHLIWAPNSVSQGFTWWVYRGLAVLTGFTLIQLFRHWQDANQKFWGLVFGLACAPSLGIVLLDLLFDKHLHQLRYLILAGPALAVIVTYGVTRLIASHQRLGMCLLTVIVGIQLTNINWGFEQGRRGQVGLDLRSVAHIIHTASSPSHVVVIGEGTGRGHPGAVMYELEPHTMTVVLGTDSNLDTLQTNIEGYDDVWLVFSVDRGTTAVEKAFVDRLQKSGRYTQIFHSWPALQLRKVNTENRRIR